MDHDRELVNPSTERCGAVAVAVASPRLSPPAPAGRRAGKPRPHQKEHLADSMILVLSGGFEAEEQWSRPTRAGDDACDLG
jgi:hypothetical protein